MASSDIHTYTHTHIRTVKDTGIVTETCFPYSAQKGKAAACIRACVDGEPFIKYKARDFYQLKTEADIQKEIMTNGPVEAGFIVSLASLWQRFRVPLTFLLAAVKSDSLLSQGAYVCTDWVLL